MLPDTWDDVKFRPLVSYRRHHWRRLLSLLCKALNFIRHVVCPGFAVDSLADLRSKLAQFNGDGCFDDDSSSHGIPDLVPDATLNFETDDIENFFTQVPRDELVDEISWACSEFINKTGHNFICILKPHLVPLKETVWVCADGPSSTRSATACMHSALRVGRCQTLPVHFSLKTSLLYTLMHT